jgi:hypothetical protein
MAATLLGLLGDDALNHVLAVYYQAKIVPCPWKESEVRKKDVHFEMIDKVARANKRLHRLSSVLRKVAIEKIRAAYFAHVVACALPLQVAKCDAFNRHLYHRDVSATSCFVSVVWNFRKTRRIVKVHLSHTARHSKAASHAIFELERKGVVEVHELSELPCYKNGVSFTVREKTFATHDYYDIPQANRTEAQKEEAAAHQKTFVAELFTWLDTSFRELNAHVFWRTRNHVDLGVF